MGKLTDLQIRAWIKAGEHFQGKSDGAGLTLAWPDGSKLPFWRYRYKLAGKARVMNIGSIEVLSLAAARETVRKLAASVTLGHDVAGEKQERKKSAVEKIEAQKSARTFSEVADEYFDRMIAPRYKHTSIPRARIENDIKPEIGKKRIEEVKPRDIDAMIQKVVDRGAPTIANDTLRLTKRIFDYAIKRQFCDVNPATAFNTLDAGGNEAPRDRWLTRDEIKHLFAAIRVVSGRFTIRNHYIVRLLLLLAVRKEELVGAKWSEFDLEKAVWKLPAERTKTDAAIDIPLPVFAVETLQELKRLAGDSAYVFPAVKMQHRMVPHISLDTINAAVAKHIRSQLSDVAPFTIHDFRRTARTHLASLNVPPHVAERCLNHKIKGVEGVYNHHDYFDERREALVRWADVVKSLEFAQQTSEKEANVCPTRVIQKARANS